MSWGGIETRGGRPVRRMCRNAVRGWKEGSGFAKCQEGRIKLGVKEILILSSDL